MPEGATLCGAAGCERRALLERERFELVGGVVRLRTSSAPDAAGRIDSAMDRGPIPPPDESELAPEITQVIEDAARSITDALDDESSELRQAVDQDMAAMEAECAELVPLALERGLTPDGAFEATRRHKTLGLAVMVRKRLWIEQLRRAPNEEFERLAAETEALSERTSSREALFRVLDEERERSGLAPSPSKATRDAKEAELWRQASDHLLAEFEAMSDGERMEMIFRGREAAGASDHESSSRGSHAGSRGHDPGPVARLLARFLGLAIGLPVIVIGYGLAALLTVIPAYVVIAVFGETYTLIPDEQHELRTAGTLLAVLTAWYVFTGLRKAVGARD